jgi:hypothetical protein
MSLPRVKEYAKQETSMKAGGNQSSAMLAEFQCTTRDYIPEDRTLHNRYCENLKSHNNYRTGFL